MDSPRILQNLILGLLTILLHGCSTGSSARYESHAEGRQHPPTFSTLRERQLRFALIQISPYISPSEAHRVAQEVLLATDKLQYQYQMIRPAFLNNALVNVGIKPRGLCYQWAEDLTRILESMNLQTFDIHRGVIHLGTWKEHSVVVLTATDEPFENGLLLDPWRHSGKLIWKRLKDDSDPWQKARPAQAKP